ncbi:hypothetical protein TrispH2_006213, partial [Trichoplax sp. H2]
WMTIDRLCECRCSTTEICLQCPLHRMQDPCEVVHDKYPNEENIVQHLSSTVLINQANSSDEHINLEVLVVLRNVLVLKVNCNTLCNIVIFVIAVAEDLSLANCYERIVLLIQYIFPEVPRQLCREIVALCNCDVFHTIFYIRHNYYVYADCDQDEQLHQLIDSDFESEYDSISLMDSPSVDFRDSADYCER